MFCRIDTNQCYFFKIYQEQGGSKKYGFDKVFTPSDTNEDVYSELIAPRIASVVQASSREKNMFEFVYLPLTNL